MVKVKIVFIASNRSLFSYQSDFPDGTTVAQALEQSRICEQFPEVQDLETGIFSKRVQADTILKNGDRIEIYRPLTNDPKEKRRQRAQRR